MIKKTIYSLIVTTLLFPMNIVAEEKDELLELKKELRIEDLDVNLNLDIYQGELNDNSNELELSLIKKQQPVIDKEIVFYYNNKIKTTTNLDLKNDILLLYGQYIKENKSLKQIQKFYEKALKKNWLKEETLGLLYFELMKISYKRLGYSKAEHYFNIIKNNFEGKEVLLQAKKEKINLLIKEGNKRKVKKIIIKELQKKHPQMKLFLLINLLDINIKLGKTSNIKKIIKNIQNSIKETKEKESIELIKEFIEIDQSKLTKEQQSYFEDFYNEIYNNQIGYPEEVVTVAMSKNIDILLKGKKWNEANKKLLALLQYFLEDKVYKQRKIDYDVTNYLINRINFKTLEEKYKTIKKESIKETINIIKKFKKIKSNDMEYINENLKKVILLNSKILNRYGLEKGNLIEEVLRIYIDKFITEENVNSENVIKFFDKYKILENNFNKLEYDKKLKVTKKIMKEKQYKKYKKVIEKIVLKNMNININKYIYSMLLIDKKKYTSALHYIKETKEKELKKEEEENVKALYYDLLFKLNKFKDIKEDILNESKNQTIKNNGIYIDILWKGYNKLKQNQIDFARKDILLRLINKSNIEEIYTYRPEIDYEFIEILKEDSMYEYQILQVLLNIERRKKLLMKLKPSGRQKLYYKLAEKYFSMKMGNSSRIYYVLCVEEKSITNKYKVLCEERIVEINQSMEKNNINWQ